MGLGLGLYGGSRQHFGIMKREPADARHTLENSENKRVSKIRTSETSHGLWSQLLVSPLTTPVILAYVFP